MVLLTTFLLVFLVIIITSFKRRFSLSLLSQTKLICYTLTHKPKGLRQNCPWPTHHQTKQLRCIWLSAGLIFVKFWWCEIRVDWMSSSVRSPSGIVYRPIPLQHYIHVWYFSWNQQRYKLQFADALTLFIEWFVVLMTVISFNKILSPLISGATWTQYW